MTFLNLLRRRIVDKCIDWFDGLVFGIFFETAIEVCKGFGIVPIDTIKTVLYGFDLFGTWLDVIWWINFIFFAIGGFSRMLRRIFGQPVNYP